MENPHILVVGGGISGLTAAYQLQRLARQSQTHFKITLVESDRRLGGKILTDRTDNMVIEAGPDSFLSSKPAALELCRELGIEDSVIGTTETGGGTYILRRGRLEPLPEGITMLVPTKFKPLLASRLLSPLGKLRMSLDFFIPPRRDADDESVGHFVRRRLGREAFERMAQPILSGIYAGDADRLSLAATFPRLRDTELKHGSLTKGMLAQRKQAAAKPQPGPKRSAFLSLRDGLGQLTDALEEALTDVDVLLGTEVTALDRLDDGRYEVSLSAGRSLMVDGIVLAVPAYAAGQMLGTLEPSVASLLSHIPYVSTATVTLAYHAGDVTGSAAGRGFVIPRVENRELTAVTWVTQKFSHRAPDGVALVRAFVGRAGREEAVELSDDDLLRLVRRELDEILGIGADPIDARIYRWRRALPQYVLGHLERLEEIDERMASMPNIQLAGAAYRGVGIPDCIQSGRSAAIKVLEALGLSKSQSTT